MKITKNFLKDLIKEELGNLEQEAVAVSTNAKVIDVKEHGDDIDFLIQIGHQTMSISFSRKGGSPLVGGDADYYDMTQPEQDAIWDALRANPKYAAFKTQQDAEAMEKYFGKTKDTAVHENEQVKKEGFYGRRRYGSSYGGGYGGGRKEEDPDWHAAPGEEFTVPGQAYQYFTIRGEEGKEESWRRKISFYSNRDLDQKVIDAEGQLEQKYGQKFVGMGKLEVISKPHKVEN